ncbi:hypothetical protein BDW60DRAFT_190383 [Aspergillus nidulans var. acristatus]
MMQSRRLGENSIVRHLSLFPRRPWIIASLFLGCWLVHSARVSDEKSRQTGNETF